MTSRAHCQEPIIPWSYLGPNVMLFSFSVLDALVLLAFFSLLIMFK